MKQIPSKIKVLHDAHLENKAISKSARFHYRKWLRYYLDFCAKYHLNETGYPLRSSNYFRDF